MDLVKVAELRDIIREELERLPDRDAFGGSNIEGKEEMKAQIEDLNRILSGGTPTRDDVKSWYEDKDDYFLKDYFA